MIRSRVLEYLEALAGQGRQGGSPVLRVLGALDPSSILQPRHSPRQSWERAVGETGRLTHAQYSIGCIRQGEEYAVLEGGRIILVGSESGVGIPADMAHHGVTKAGQLALGNGFAKLTRGTGVTVNTILGGPTSSDGVAATIDRVDEAQQVTVDELKAMIVGANRTSLLERFIEPEEIAHLTVFLGSPLSSAANGAAVRADGEVLTAVH